MIIQARSNRLCQGCRHNLLVLFERGFCTATYSSRLHLSTVQQRSHRRLNQRNLSYITRLHTSVSQASLLPKHSAPDDDFQSDNTHLISQIAAVEQLEKDLGVPPDEVINEHDVSPKLIAEYRDKLNALEARVAEESGLLASSDPVANLRNAGASGTDIVRKARQVYGDALPESSLNDQELGLYRRLYGDPVLEIDEVEESEEVLASPNASVQNQLFSAKGEEIGLPISDLDPGNQHDENKALSVLSSTTELDIVQLKELAQSVRGTYMEEEEGDEDIEDELEDSEPDRGHPLTIAGKFRTSPKTTFLSQDGFVKPVERIMSNYSNKHLKEVCERKFGGPGLPDSPLTPRSGRARKQVPIPLDVNQNTMSEMEANAFISAVMPPTYASVTSVLTETRKRLGPTWLNNLLTKADGPRVLDAGGAGVGILAWRDVVQAHWQSLHTSDESIPLAPASKAVVVTGSDGLRHRAAEMLENTTFIPRLPDYVHTRSTPTLEDDRPSQQRKQFDVIIAPHTLFGLKEDWMRKQYVQNLWTMLSDEGGVLILIEKGVARGFEAIAGARDMLLDRYIAIPEGYTTHYSKSHAQQLDEEGIHQKQKSMIVAPCTNHEKCPMYTVAGHSYGRKDICSFQQRYIRPAFLQRILGAKDRNHDDVDFSYLSVMKGDDIRTRDVTNWDQVIDPLSAPVLTDEAELSQLRSTLAEEAREGYEHVVPDPEDKSKIDSSEDPMVEQLPTFHQMPRVVYPPLKRKGHVSIDLCTPTGQIERWTIPKSFSRVAYHDARKSKWGDLWALGAKTHIPRNLKLGSPEKKLIDEDGDVINGSGRGRKERLKIKAMQMLDQQEEEKMNDLMEQRDLMAAVNEELEAETSHARYNNADDKLLSTTKPKNNRERKAARRTTRQVRMSLQSQSAVDSADLTFKPRPTQFQEQNSVDELTMEHTMSEWQAEFDRAASMGKGKKGGAYSKFGSSSRAAKSLQRSRS